MFPDYVKENDRLPNLQGFEYYSGGIFELKTGGSGVVAELSEELAETNSLPSGWDWRDRHGENWVTPIRNQGSCGSCWAFSVVGATETLTNLYFNQHINNNSHKDKVQRYLQKKREFIERFKFTIFLPLIEVDALDFTQL